MPPKPDGNIATFFQPREEGKGKSEVEKPTVKTPGEAPIATSKQEEKGKRKRPSSSSPPIDKRRDTRTAPTNTPTHFSVTDLPPNWLSSKPEKAPEGAHSTLSFTVHKGNLFNNVPPKTLLIHACNTQGSWGAGIARAFRSHYPAAYTVYRNFCTQEHDPKTNPIPTGTALLIAPVDVGKEHWIGCLFTSAKYGKAKASPEVILRNTVPAMQTLLELVQIAGGVGGVRMCKINSGLFGVPWERTVEALEGIEMLEGWEASVDVWEP